MPLKKSRRRKSVRKLRPVKLNCGFCKGKFNPDYKKYEDLFRFMTERGKIMPKTRTGLCAKHQRKVAKEIKRARHLGFLPFTVGL